MEISHEELLKRLNSGKNLVNALDPTPGTFGQPRLVQKPESERPRRPYPDALDPITRTTVGILGHLDSVKNVAKEFGATPGQVQSAMTTANPAVAKAREEAKERIADIALTRLMESMNLLTPDKLENEKPRDIANIAAQMSKVHKNLSGGGDDGNPKPAQIIVYAPQIRTEKSFGDAIDV